MWPFARTIRKRIVDVDYYANSYLKVELREYEACKTCPDQICCSTFEIPLTLNESLSLKYDPEKWQRGLSVIQRIEGGTCIYHTQQGCSIYSKRPIACMEYICKNDSRIAEARGEYVKKRGLKSMVSRNMQRIINFSINTKKALKKFAFLPGLKS